MKEMPPRERLTAALRRQPADRLPWTVDLGYYNAALREQKRLDPKYDSLDGYLRQHEEIGADPYFTFPSASPYRREYGAVTCETTRSGNDMITRWRLGNRSLVGMQRFLPESYCWAWARHPVESVAELETFLQVAKAFRFVPDTERHRLVQTQCGERALVICGLPRGPIASLMAEWCGVAPMAYLRADAPDLFEETLSTLERMTDPLILALAEYRPVAVHFCDNISGENVGTYWDRYMAPYYRRQLTLLHEAGIACVIHTDGTVRSVLPKIAAVGFDGAEALTPAPVGDVDAADLRALCGRDDFILWGGVPGAMFPPVWSERDFRAHVERVLDTVAGPFILGSADQIPPDGDLARVKIVADILKGRQR